MKHLLILISIFTLNVSLAQQPVAIDTLLLDEQIDKAIEFSNLALKHIEAENEMAALALIDSAISINPKRRYYEIKFKALIKFRRFEELIAFSGDYLADPSCSADDFYQVGLAYFHLQRFDEAIPQFTKAIEFALKDEGLKYRAPTFLYNRGVCRLMIKEYQGAADDFSAAVELDSKFAQAYHNRGTAYVNLKDLSAACSDFRKAKELGSDRSDTFIAKYCQE